jgi:hypothetical protein
MEDTAVLHHHNQTHPDSPHTPRSPELVGQMKKVDDISLNKRIPDPPVQELASASLEDGKGKSV